MRPKFRLLVMSLSLAAHAGLLAVLARTLAAPPSYAVAGAIEVSLQDGRDVTPRISPPSMATLQPVEPVPPVLEVEIRAADLAVAEPLFVSRTMPEETPVFETVSEAALTVPSPLSSPRALAEGETCQLTLWVQNALSNDLSVRAALSAIPRESRSIANAIMLWNGGWVETRSVTAAQSRPIREAIVQGVAGAPLACRDETLHGPLLIAVPDRFGTTLLAVGSGVWKWSDLLPEDFEPAS